MDKDKLIEIIAEKVNRQLPSFYRTLGFEKDYIYIITLQTDDGDVRISVALFTNTLFNDILNKYLEYQIDSSIEIVEWVESFIEKEGLTIRSSLWG